MNDNAWAGQISAPLAIVAGIIICFLGYRLLKVSLAIIGFAAGAYTAWQFALSVARVSNGLAMVCALIGGLIGAGLCLWLYYVGVFLIGAAAGTVIASAISNAAGHQLQPIVLLALPLLFGIIALLAQKFMIVLSTAFSGAYLITAGLWPFIAGDQNPSRIWLDPMQQPAPGMLGYAALVLWLALGIFGASVQFHAGRKRVEPTTQPT